MKKLYAVAALTATLLTPMIDARAATFQQDAERVITQLTTRWNAGDAAGAAAVFGDDAQIVGEGDPSAVTGRDALNKTIEELVTANKAVRIDVRKFVTLGKNAGYAWVLWSVTPRDAKDKPFTVRSLFVLTRQTDGLKIRCDSYSVGVY